MAQQFTPVDAVHCAIESSIKGNRGKKGLPSKSDLCVFQRLKDYDAFRWVRVAFDTIEWDAGIDLDPEFVFAKCAGFGIERRSASKSGASSGDGTR